MRRLSGLAITTALVLGLVAAPAMAVVQQPVGTRLNLFLVNQAFPASTAFHIRDGFLLRPGTDATGKFTFALDVDGAARSPDFKQNSTTSTGDLVRLWVFNIPAGMTGTHYLWTPPGSSAPKDVRTTPGCSAVAVTPLPRNRPDSSWVNGMLAAFDDDGRAGLGEPTGDPGATPPDAPGHDGDASRQISARPRSSSIRPRRMRSCGSRS
jgi:hypothetical protein